MGTEGQSKVCTACGRVLPLAEFYKDSRRRDGRYSECRTCTLARRKSDAEKTRPVKAAWRAKRREHLRAYGARYYQANKEKRNESQRRYRAKKRAARSAQSADGERVKDA